MVQLPLRERQVVGSNPSRTIPKELNIVLAAPLLTLAFKGSARQLVLGKYLLMYICYVAK